MGSGTTELAKAGWFLCGIAAGLLLAVMRREAPEMVRAVVREFNGQALGDTVQITGLEQTEPPGGRSPEGSSGKKTCD